MLWVGLTGGIASGKSTVSRILVDRGYVIVDADKIVQELSQPGTPAHNEICQAFGPEILNSDGSIDRKKLGDFVFRDKSKLSVLEEILHPKVRNVAQAKRQELEQKGIKIAFYDVPLLFEKKMESLFDRIVVVTCSRKNQIERLMARNGLSLVEAELRLKAQIPLEFKSQHAHDVILNDSNQLDLQLAVDKYLDNLNKLLQ